MQLTRVGQPRATSMVTALWQDCGKSESFGCRLNAQGDQRGSRKCGSCSSVKAAAAWKPQRESRSSMDGSRSTDRHSKAKAQGDQRGSVDGSRSTDRRSKAKAQGDQRGSVNGSPRTLRSAHSDRQAACVLYLLVIFILLVDVCGLVRAIGKRGFGKK